MDTLISPRIALKARDAFLVSNNIMNLKFISALDFTKIEVIKHAILERKQEEKLAGILVDLTTAVNKLTLLSSANYTALVVLKDTVSDVLSHYDLLNDELINKATKLHNSLADKEIEFRHAAHEMGTNHIRQNKHLKSLYEDFIELTST
jgi:hypothetical protein